MNIFKNINHSDSFFISSICGLISAFGNIFILCTFNFLSFLKDPEGFGFVLGAVFISPFLISMVIFKILSKCIYWFYLDIIFWIFCFYAFYHNYLLIVQFFQVVLILLPIIQYLIYTKIKNKSQLKSKTP
jgi:hypothetical protein